MLIWLSTQTSASASDDVGWFPAAPVTALITAALLTPEAFIAAVFLTGIPEAFGAIMNEFMERGTDQIRSQELTRRYSDCTMIKTEWSSLSRGRWEKSFIVRRTSHSIALGMGKSMSLRTRTARLS